VRLDGSAGYIESRLGGSLEVRAGVRGGTRRPFLGADLSLGGQARLFHGERSRKIASEPLDVFARATRRLVAAMLEALDRGEVPPPHGGDNRHTLALMLAAYESAERGATVRVGG
jgi:predicted dehydrogenase